MAQELRNPLSRSRFLSAGLRFSHLCFTQSLIKSLEAWKTLPFAPAPALELIVYRSNRRKIFSLAAEELPGAEPVVKSCFITSINSSCGDFLSLNCPGSPDTLTGPSNNFGRLQLSGHCPDSQFQEPPNPSDCPEGAAVAPFKIH